MFFKKAFCAVVLVTTVFCGVVTSSESKNYVLENLKRLNNLIRKKESAKPNLQLAILFDEYVDDTKKLLEDWHKQGAEEPAKNETVKQIAHYIAVLQKLLTIMDSSASGTLEYFCLSQRNDELWGSICGDRPTKRIQRQEIYKIEDGSMSSEKIKNSSLVPGKTQHLYDDNAEQEIDLEK